MKRKSKTITNKQEIEYFINLKEEDITSSFIMETFGEFDGKCKYHPYDIITLPPNSYKNNKNSFTTTLGLYIYNKYFIEKDLSHLFENGYISNTINKKQFKKINSVLSYALIEDKILLEQMKKYLMKTQKFMPYVSILSPSYTIKMLTSTKVINKKKNELIKKYKKEIEAGDPVIAEKMTNELIDYAKEYLKDDPSMDLYNSGARSSFGNDFKNMFIMKGAISDPKGKGYDIALSNYMDGITKEEYKVFANSLTEGPYRRAKKTEVGGYLEKQFVAAYQHVVLDKPNSDCHSDKYIEVVLTEKNIDMYMYNYIIEGKNNFVELTSDVKNKYINKKVKMRFSSLCKNKVGICNKCAGNLFYRIGIENVGLAESIVASTLKNASMKSFHNSTVVTSEMNPMVAFGL